MFNRKSAVFMAVAGILATAGFAVADESAVQVPTLTLDTAAADAAPSGPLMMGLDKIGAGDTLNKLGLNIYGWVEVGYTYDHRHGHKTVAPILPGPFNHEFGSIVNGSSASGGDRNHVMLNQVDIRFERLVKSDKWDVGGMLEAQYGTDADAIHANGFALGNESYRGRGGDIDADDRFNPEYQPDITQAYIDVNIPVGNGLIIRTGKFVTLMGYEMLNPMGNPFYSHSYLFSAIPFTQTGMYGIYKINDQWEVKGGFSRGWDQSLEDNNGSSLDALGQVIFTPTKTIQARFNWTCGPEDNRDSSHYRTALDAVVTWQATEQLQIGGEAIYVYDGGRNAQTLPTASRTHAYGDQWGFALYGAYKINDYCTLNTRIEKFHDYAFDALESNAEAAAASSHFSGIPTINVYGITLGTTIKPFPKDPIGKNLLIRPEIRYTYSEDHIFAEASGLYKDQLTFGCDVIFGF